LIRELHHEDMALQKSGPRRARSFRAKKRCLTPEWRFSWRLGAIAIVALVALPVIGVFALHSYGPPSSEEHQIRIGNSRRRGFDPRELAAEATSAAATPTPLADSAPCCRCREGPATDPAERHQHALDYRSPNAAAERAPRTLPAGSRVISGARSFPPGTSKRDIDAADSVGLRKREY